MRTTPLIQFYTALAPDKGWHQTTELLIRWLWDMETSIGLLWYPTVRDYFRHLWE